MANSKSDNESLEAELFGGEEAEVTKSERKSAQKSEPVAGAEPEKPGAAGRERWELTWHGYPLDEALSAMQKMIRRGQEKPALFWAREIADHHHKLVWHRLQVIAVEDVGMAVPWVPVLVRSLREMFMEMHDRESGEKNQILAHAVLCLARSPKNHETSDFHISMCQEIERGMRYEVPDVAIDGHTRRGKKRGVGAEHFMEHGYLVTNRFGGNHYRPDGSLDETGAGWTNNRGKIPWATWREDGPTDETLHEGEEGWVRGEKQSTLEERWARIQEAVEEDSEEAEDEELDVSEF